MKNIHNNFSYKNGKSKEHENTRTNHENREQERNIKVEREREIESGVRESVRVVKKQKKDVERSFMCKC